MGRVEIWGLLDLRSFHKEDLSWMLTFLAIAITVIKKKNSRDSVKKKKLSAHVPLCLHSNAEYCKTKNRSRALHLFTGLYRMDPNRNHGWQCIAFGLLKSVHNIFLELSYIKMSCSNYIVSLLLAHL